MPNIFTSLGLQGPPGPAMPPCVAATTGALPSYTGTPASLIATANGAFPAQDGITLVVGEYLLVKNETSGNAVFNLITVLNDAGSASTPWKLGVLPNVVYRTGLTVSVGLGTANTRKFFMLTTRGPIVVGTTALTWQGNL